MEERLALRKALRKNPKMARLLQGMVESGKLKAADPSDTEPLMFICKRWPGLVDDCRMALCHFCGHEVALAPSSQQIIDTTKAEVKYCCMECFQDGAAQRYEDEQKKLEEVKTKAP